MLHGSTQIRQAVAVALDRFNAANGDLGRFTLSDALGSGSCFRFKMRAFSRRTDPQSLT